MTCKPALRVWRLLVCLWVWKNWKTFNIHWPLFIFSVFVSILLCTWKWLVLLKIHCHKHCLVLLSARELCIITGYYSALLMLCEKFEMIQTFLLGLCFEHSVNKSVRSDVHTTGKTLQEEAVITAVQRMADLSPVAFLRWKKLLFCTGTNPKCFTFFPPQDGMSTKCLFWTENLEVFHSSWPLYEFTETCNYLSLLLQEQLHVAILAVGSSAMPVQRCLHPTELSSDNSDAFPAEAVAQFLPGFSLFVDEPINCHLNPQSLSKHQAISPPLK